MTKKNFVVEIKDANGSIIYKNDRVEAPDTWSQNAVNITASKFFHGEESSVYALVDRVVDRIYQDGKGRRYPIDEAWRDKLKALCLGQYGSFNSPVWFNIGVQNRPQRASACFILSVADDMDSILELQRAEATIFKYGGGAGSNLSALRSSFEYVGQTGSKSSGPLGFMHGYDSWAGVIKSGSKARRAAKMTVLDVEHPDILKFIAAKPLGERVTKALIAAGFKNDFTSDDGAQHWAPYQNANLSVRVGDNFMQAVKSDAQWNGALVRGPMPSGSVTAWTLPAKEIFRKISEAAWHCGDPGLQFADTINAWNCVPRMGRIKASNPCSEFVFPDDSACNLASLNLLKFRKPNGSFDFETFGAAIDVLIVAMDILCDFADYPTDAIEHNSLDYRPLGLGYANLGALLIANGLPYDSDEARKLAAEITSFMTAKAYRRSVELAQKMGVYAGWHENSNEHLRVLEKHSVGAKMYTPSVAPLWRETRDLAARHGLRNAQVTLLAPTGTIGFMMGCDSFGIEPLDCIAKTKKLVGGGQMAIVADVVKEGLKTLGYEGGYGRQPDAIFARLRDGQSFGQAGIDPEHWPIFATSYGELPISTEGHLKMMAAVQPFLSGAISKTVALPKGSTVEDVERTYVRAWELGLKCIALYVDGSKADQPIEPVREKKAIAQGKVSETLAMSDAGGHIPMAITQGGAPIDAESLMDQQEQWMREQSAMSSHPLVGSKCQESALGDGDGAAVKYPCPGTIAADGICDRASEHWPPEAHQEILRKLAADSPTTPPPRRRLPDERQAITHKFNVGGHEGYLTVGLYEDGKPGELFVKMAKEGSTTSGFLDAFATAISLLLQYGVPLDQLAAKFKGGRFAPEGWTTNPEIRQASSVLDYIFRWMEGKFGEEVRCGTFGQKIEAVKGLAEAGALPPDVVEQALKTAPTYPKDRATELFQRGVPVDSLDDSLDLSNPSCSNCGGATRKSGTCFTCENCGSTSGGCA